MMSAYWNSLIALSLVAPNGAEAACNLSMKWGLESTANFRELSQFGDETSAFGSNTKAGPKLRAFRMSSAGDATIQRYFARHWDILKVYKSSHPATGPIDRTSFVAWARNTDPFYVSLGRSLAPVLYFDFTGNSQNEYVLDQVEIQTVSFDEYSGGGFYDSKAWYDVELSTKAGTHTINVDKRLRFTGSGRAELTFFSSNYYPGVAMTPQGSFKIALTFIFLRDGEKCRVSTGRFMVDA
jgi:hypothetical protein